MYLSQVQAAIDHITFGLQLAAAVWVYRGKEHVLGEGFIDLWRGKT